jgi:hypothetical protein
MVYFIFKYQNIKIDIVLMHKPLFSALKLILVSSINGDHSMWSHFVETI